MIFDKRTIFYVRLFLNDTTESYAERICEGIWNNVECRGGESYDMKAIFGIVYKEKLSQNNCRSSTKDMRGIYFATITVMVIF